jgi:hypothetical protein
MNRPSNSEWETPLLIVIALLLAVIALKPTTQPQPVMAEGNFNEVQFTGAQGAFWLFDARNGDIWQYNTESGLIDGHFKITKPGGSLEVIKIKDSVDK